MAQHIPETTVSIFLHYLQTANSMPKNDVRKFGRIPCVGEHVALDEESGLYRVVYVEHCAFPDDNPASDIAEVWAIYAGNVSEVRTREITDIRT